MSANPYRDLPSVDVLISELETPLPHAVSVAVVRRVLDEARGAIGQGEPFDVRSQVHEAIRTKERSASTTVLNASGVLLHTNIGRAPWSTEAIDRSAAVAGGYSNLELDLASGERGSRGSHVTTLLAELTGAEAALVVNNNAAALLLAVASTSRGKAVPVSRGELIEIGGSYRLPEVIDAGGAHLVEIGTTNRTRVGDYETALQTHDCGALLKVHPSNYSVDGFTQEASLENLAKLASSRSLPLLFDAGSGLLDSTWGWVPDWISGEPAVKQSLEAGADIVMFSGDKLLGGPQAGVIVGSSEVVGHMRANPLARALRVDGATYAGLEATLEAYLAGEPERIPFWRMALTPPDTIRERVIALAAEVGGEVEAGTSMVGGGSAPNSRIDTPVLRLRGRQKIYELLLAAETPVLTRRDAGDLVVDLRAIDPGDDPIVTRALTRCL